MILEEIYGFSKGNFSLRENVLESKQEALKSGILHMIRISGAIPLFSRQKDLFPIETFLLSRLEELFICFTKAL